ncbi:hypothetical protein C8Q74DRAFT_1365764 [Fomes fomentarius]|nr:hypothetical protein C8Q74DRAFT_1365764 [Fomes fomentarius]
MPRPARRVTEPAYPSFTLVALEIMAVLPAYRSAHTRRHHPYPAISRALRRQLAGSADTLPLDNQGSSLALLVPEATVVHDDVNNEDEANAITNLEQAMGFPQQSQPSTRRTLYAVVVRLAFAVRRGYVTVREITKGVSTGMLGKTFH